jgi:N-acetylglucosaminyltransferase
MSQFVIVALRVVVAAYLTLFLVHSVLELVYAWRSTRSRRDRSTEAAGLTRWPDVDVVVPCFNEDPVLLDACCRSLARQDYPGRLRVWLADDGSRNLDMLRPVYRRYEGGDWSVILMPRNTGKREAQDAAVRQGDGELVLMMDSDTVIAPDAIHRAAAAFANPRVGALSGRIRVLNASANLLTRLIHHRYRLRFEVERAAQGWFGSLLCCPGPFSMYRRSLLEREEVWPRYLTQTFAGITCTNGDDLHLTNLVLATGHRLVLDPGVCARTRVPTALGTYLRQQLRWNRSFYRELWWTFAGLKFRHPYLALDVLARALLPLLLGSALLLLASEGALVGWELMWRDLVLLLAMLLVSSVFVLAHGASVEFLLLYGALHVTLLIPVRVYALLTLASTRWETR